jgi:tRNA A-37 threonylcarbamoyl transferase component Bud32
MSIFGIPPTRIEINEAACDDKLRGVLLAAAARPPAGMVLCKYGSRSVVGTFDTDTGKFVLKYYYPKNLLKRLTYGFFGSRALRSWEVALELKELGIPTAQPLVFCEWRSLLGLVLDRSYLAVGHAEGPDLLTYVLSYADDAERLAELAGHLKKSFDRMEQNRVAHGDLKATNIIVGVNGEVTFIDLDATEINVPAARWAKARTRDVKLFMSNWQNLPGAAAAFHDVFGGVR